LNRSRSPEPQPPDRADAESWVGDPMISAERAQRDNAVRFLARLRKSATRHRNIADAQDRAAGDRTRHAKPWHSWRADGQRRAADADDPRADDLSKKLE